LRSSRRANDLCWVCMRPALFLALVVGSVACVSCHREKSLELRDSEGRSFRATCDKDPCSLEQTGGPKWPNATESRLVLQGDGRVVGVCNAPDDARVPSVAPVPSSADCRALVCQRDEECPPAHGIDHGTCLNGLCTDQSHEVTPGDSVMLCLFGTGLGRDARSQVERFAMAQQCGSPCQVPSPCRQLSKATRGP